MTVGVSTSPDPRVLPGSGKKSPTVLEDRAAQVRSTQARGQAQPAIPQRLSRCDRPSPSPSREVNGRAQERQAASTPMTSPRHRNTHTIPRTPTATLTPTSHPHRNVHSLSPSRWTWLQSLPEGSPPPDRIEGVPTGGRESGQPCRKKLPFWEPLPSFRGSNSRLPSWPWGQRGQGNQSRQGNSGDHEEERDGNHPRTRIAPPVRTPPRFAGAR